jgi:hypothetical protein
LRRGAYRSPTTDAVRNYSIDRQTLEGVHRVRSCNHTWRPWGWSGNLSETTRRRCAASRTSTFELTPQLLARDHRAVAWARSLAQAICGWTRPPRPQSVPAMMFYWSTSSANAMTRSATGKPKGVRSLFLTNKRLMRLFDVESLASVIVALDRRRTIRSHVMDHVPASHPPHTT